MRALLDTHVFLCWLYESTRLSPRVREILATSYSLSVAAKKGTSLAVETEPGAGLRSGPRWAQE